MGGWHEAVRLPTASRPHTPASAAPASAFAARPTGGAQALLALQRSAGNRAVTQLLRRSAGGAPCSACAGEHRPASPDGPAALEGEADRIAERVMRAPDPGAGPIRPRGAARAGEATLQRHGEGGLGATAAPPLVHEVLRAPGSPLDAGARSFFEPRFGRSFEGVRVHDGPQAAASARTVDADAYTVGSRIAFAEGLYQPGTPAGRRLIAHELAHVVQQSEPGGAIAVRRQGKAGKSRGRVLFVQVDRTASTITFVTESGSLRYTLTTPTEVATGSYDFGVSVKGNNLNLSAPGTVTSFSGFRYRIAAGQPNPADLLRAEKHVSVQVIEGDAAASPGSKSADATGAPASADAGATPESIPVTYTAIPLDDPAPGLPGVSGVAAGAGLGLHNLAFNDLSWLDSPLSSSYWGPLVPRSGITLERSLNTLPRNLTPTLQSFLASQKPGDPLTWLSQNRKPIDFRPDPASPATRAFTSEELLSIEGLVRRYNANPSSLSPAELQLVREAARIHIGGSTPTAPFSSYSQPGKLVPWTANRRYVVRVNVDRGAALDVSKPNAFNQGAEAITNVEEAEFLVVGDMRGRIISVQRVASLKSGASWATRNANAIRWGGRLVVVAGVAYSGYRIASASPEERPKVVGQEVGGQLGGIAGGALATAGCIAFGIVTEGAGLFLCGLMGGVVGGGVGSAVGGGLPGFINDAAAEAYHNSALQRGDEFPPGSEAAMDFWMGPSLF